MANIERRSFQSAQEAFDHLNADTVPFSSLAARKLIQLGTVLSTLDPWTRPGGYFNPPSRGVGKLMERLFDNGDVAKLSCKAWKCVKARDSDDVCFYSDSYELDLPNADALASVCDENGLEVRIFEWDYPRLAFDQRDLPPSRTAKIMGKGKGYDQLYRGKLVGFVVGAYNRQRVR